MKSSVKEITLNYIFLHLLNINKMRFITPLTLAVIARVVCIPQGNLDRPYRSFVDERGVELHKRLSANPSAIPEYKGDVALTTPNNATNNLQAREQNMFCGCGLKLNTG